MLCSCGAYVRECSGPWYACSSHPQPTPGQVQTDAYPSARLSIYVSMCPSLHNLPRASNSPSVWDNLSFHLGRPAFAQYIHPMAMEQSKYASTVMQFHLSCTATSPQAQYNTLGDPQSTHCDASLS